jgi:hypothetical protein
MRRLDHGTVPPLKPTAYAYRLAGQPLEVDAGSGEGIRILALDTDGESRRQSSAKLR